jgi:hypothetical protein
MKPSEFNRKILEIVSQGKETGEEVSIHETGYLVKGKKKVFLNIITLGRSLHSREIGEPFLVSEEGDIFSFSQEQIEIIAKTMITNKIGCSALIRRGIGYDSAFLDLLSTISNTK